VQAVVQTEGDIVKAVQCSDPSITTRDLALRVLCRSLIHALWLFAANDPKAFVSLFGSRWAPVGVENDPHDLNVHFIPNMLALWTSSHAHAD
jgi:hypothetical protein